LFAIAIYEHRQLPKQPVHKKFSLKVLEFQMSRYISKAEEATLNLLIDETVKECK